MAVKLVIARLQSQRLQKNQKLPAQLQNVVVSHLLEWKVVTSKTHRLPALVIGILEGTSAVLQIVGSIMMTLNVKPLHLEHRKKAG